MFRISQYLRELARAERDALKIRCLLADACRGSDILYSSRILKKTGLRLRAGGE